MIWIWNCKVLNEQITITWKIFIKICYFFTGTTLIKCVPAGWLGYRLPVCGVHGLCGLFPDPLPGTARALHQGTLSTSTYTFPRQHKSLLVCHAGQITNPNKTYAIGALFSHAGMVRLVDFKQVQINAWKQGGFVFPHCTNSQPVLYKSFTITTDYL